jgi:hypothetical protein
MIESKETKSFAHKKIRRKPIVPADQSDFTDAGQNCLRGK